MNEIIDLDLSNIEKVYQDDGPLAEQVSSYTYREQQVELAATVADTLRNKKILLAEAGTGTGKTLAYLIPALISNTKVIISTGTKNLQNQLYYRDLPLAIKAMSMPVKKALLKGRANYLCKYRMELALTDLLLASKDMVIQLKQIVSWAESTNDGDISTLDDIPEESEIWGHVTSTPDNCLAKDCPFINKCFVYKARQKALDAKVVVINHHLLLSDWGIKEEHVDARLLPEGANLILDEAHQLAHIASSYFGTKVSSKQIKSLCGDIQNEQKQNAKDQVVLSKKAKAVIDALDKLQKYIVSDSDKQERGFYKALYKDDIFRLDFHKLLEVIGDLIEIVQVNAERSKGLSLAYEKLLELDTSLELFNHLETNLGSKKLEKNVLWYEIFRHNFVLKQSPLEISKLFSEKLEESTRACVLTSATITVKDDFSLIKHDLGLEQARTLKIASPFDYANRSLLYVPRGMPDPNADKYIDCYCEQVAPVVESAKGGVFLLFTSFRAMHLAYERLTEQFKQSQSKIECIMQGEASKTSLIKKFTNNSNQVLFATNSFWEGVDVKGPDLHCVVIDKLPFTAPSDPVLMSKINHLRKAGKNPFLELQCQQAALQLVQGAGRLIRSEADYGVLMICDPRIISKSYGDLFLDTLPDMPRTRSLGKVTDFYDKFAS